jgi:TetR/AcrR family transcriptional regulator
MHHREAHQGDGADRLVAAARRLFARRGFYGVSVKDLVQAAKVTRPVLYYHFHSKEGLYVEANRKAAAEYETAFECAASGSTGVVERIGRVCEAYALAVRESARPAAVPGSKPETNDGGVADVCACERLSQVVEVLRGLITEGSRAGEIADCDAEDAALALAGAAAVTAMRFPEGRPGARRRDRLDGVLALVLRGLERRSAP